MSHQATAQPGQKPLPSNPTMKSHSNSISLSPSSPMPPTVTQPTPDPLQATRLSLSRESQEYRPGKHLEILLGPSAKAKRKTRLYPPFVVRASGMGNPNNYLGSLTLSKGPFFEDILVNGLVDGPDDVYFYFPDITLHDIGEYSVQIRLMKRDRKIDRFIVGWLWTSVHILHEDSLDFQTPQLNTEQETILAFAQGRSKRSSDTFQRINGVNRFEASTETLRSRLDRLGAVAQSQK